MRKHSKLQDMDARKLLRETGIFQEYLSILETMKDQLIVIAVKDTPGFELTEAMDRQLKAIGITSDLTGKHWHGYIAVIHKGKPVYEELGEIDQAVAKQMEISPGLKLCVVSKPLNAGNDVEIAINGEDHAVKRRGLNIVVYDIQRRYVIDSVCFDTHDRSIAADREQRTIIGTKTDIREKSTVTKEYVKRLDIRTLLPEQYQEAIKVRLVFWGGVYFWNTQKSIIKAFQEDSRFDVKIIIYGSYDMKKKEDILRRNHCDAIYMHQYNVSKDRPDILIISPGADWSVYKKQDLEDFQRYAALTAAIPMTLIKFSDQPMKRHLDKIMNDTSKSIDYFLFDRLIYQEAKKENLTNEQMVEIGHPKFDEIYYFMQNKKELPDDWKKIKDKKIVLWTTDHVYESENVTIDLYMEEVLRYFEAHSDMALIFRPHPILIVELLDAGVWTEEDLNKLKRFMKSTPNMIWDDLPEYAMSYSIADAIIADCNCGISVSALVTEKPLGIFFRYDDRKCIPAHPQVVEALYRIHNVEEACNFFDMISKGQDPMKEVRQEARRQYISHFDGQNGRRIKAFIVEKYLEKFDLPKVPGGG